MQDKHGPKKENNCVIAPHTCAFPSQTCWEACMLAEHGTLPALGQHQAALCSCGTGSASMQLCDVAGPVASGDRSAGCVDRHLCLRVGRPAAECRCLIVRVLQRNTALLYEHLCCCLISSVGFPPASSPLPPILWTAQTSVILPASEDSAKTLRRMKTIVLVCLRRHNLRLRQAFSPRQKPG